jgi:hypothetical protein
MPTSGMLYFNENLIIDLLTIIPPAFAINYLCSAKCACR